MAEKYKPRKEVLSFLEKACKGEEPDEGRPILCIGREQYDNKRIIKEIKKGTRFGKGFYKQLELAYDEVIGKGDSITPEDIASYMFQALALIKTKR